jgi:methionyl-tRNA synthetase
MHGTLIMQQAELKKVPPEQIALFYHASVLNTMKLTDIFVHIL